MNQMIFKCGTGEILDVAIELKNHPKESDIFKVQILQNRELHHRESTGDRGHIGRR